MPACLAAVKTDEFLSVVTLMPLIVKVTLSIFLPPYPFAIALNGHAVIQAPHLMQTT